MIFHMKKKPEQEYFSAEMSSWLMQTYNVRPEDAFKMSKDFWNRNKNKLKNAITLQ